MPSLRRAASLLSALRDKYDAWLAGKFFSRDYRALAEFDIGEYTYGLPRVLFADSGRRLTIGRYCSIASGVTIMLGGDHRVDWVTTYPFNIILPDAHVITGNPCSKGDVVIGNDVWIGRDALLLSGIDIGDGAVVGARSIVTRSVPPYAIVVGNPARIVRYRFPPGQIEAMLRIHWWNWDIDRVREALPLMLSADVQAFIERHSKGVSVPQSTHCHDNPET